MAVIPGEAASADIPFCQEHYLYGNVDCDTVTLLKWKQENKVTGERKGCVPIYWLSWLSCRLAVLENKIQERPREDSDHQPARNYVWHLRRNHQEWEWRHLSLHQFQDDHCQPAPPLQSVRGQAQTSAKPSSGPYTSHATSLKLPHWGLIFYIEIDI